MGTLQVVYFRCVLVENTSLTAGNRKQANQSSLESSSCLRERQLSRMLTCPRTSSRMLWTVPHRLLRNTTLRKTLLLSSRRSLTKSTTPHGTQLLDVTLAATSPMSPSTSSTSTSDKSPSCCSNLDRHLFFISMN